MKITVTGSLGNISKPLATTLIKAGHEVSIISSSEDKRAAIEALGATALIGSVSDAAFLTRAFAGADAVYTMVPPNFAAPDFRAYANQAGQNYAAAIKAGAVKKVVNLSSIGAHLVDGTGPIKGLHDVEGILNSLDGVAVKHLRAGFFYLNLLGNIGMIREAGIMGANYGADTTLMLVHPNDIAAAAAVALESSFSGHTVEYVVSDERTAANVAKVLGEAIGKPELPWVTFTDEQSLQGMLQAGLPQEMSSLYVEMGQAAGSGMLWEDYVLNRSVTGKTKLEDFAAAFAQAYNK